MKRRWINVFRNDKIIFLLIAFVGFVITLAFSRNKIFWGDELITISCIRGGLEHILGAASWAFIEYNPPLFNILAYLWTNIIPWDEMTYLLLPIVCVASGLYFVGLTAYEIGGRFPGIVAEAFGVFSSSIMVGVSLQFRPYALLFMTSSLAVWAFVHGWKAGKHNYGYYIVFGILMAFVAYSHNMGVFVCLTCFLWDSWMCFQKKSSLRYVSSYFLAAVLYLPRLYTIFFSPYTPVSDPASETLADFGGFTLWVVGNQTILLGWFLLSVLFLVLSCKKQKDDIRWFFIFGTIGMMGVLFCIAKLIPEHIYFTARFFTFMIPSILVVMGLGANELYKRISNIKARWVVGIVASVLMCFSIGNSFEYVKTHLNPQDFKTCGEHILSDSDAMNDSTVVTSLTWNGGVPILEGFQYCYLRNNQNQYVKTMPYYLINAENKENVLSYNKIYVVTIEGEHVEEQEMFLSEYYNKQIISEGLECWVKK